MFKVFFKWLLKLMETNVTRKKKKRVRLWITKCTFKYNETTTKMSKNETTTCVLRVLHIFGYEALTCQCRYGSTVKGNKSLVPTNLSTTAANIQEYIASKINQEIPTTINLCQDKQNIVHRTMTKIMKSSLMVLLITLNAIITSSVAYRVGRS